MNSLLEWVITTLNSTSLSFFVMHNAYLFPFLEMLHFVGLCLLFGSLIVVDLRVIGFAPAVPIQRVEIYIRFALIGFAINLCSGILFVIGDSDRYLVNIAFWAKMVAIFLAGLNTAYFVRRVKPQIERGLTSAQLTWDSKAVAWISLTLWTCVIIFGRFIPYVEKL
jgi:uncharacterized membrane protein